MSKNLLSDAARGTAVRKCDTYAAVPQWQREGTQNARVAGSNPACGTISKVVIPY